MDCSVIATTLCATVGKCRIIIIVVGCVAVVIPTPQGIYDILITYIFS